METEGHDELSNGKGDENVHERPPDGRGAELGEARVEPERENGCADGPLRVA